MARLARKSWIITYGNNGLYLEFGDFNADSDPRLSSIDEFHYTSDRAVVYAYAHFQHRLTYDSLSSFMGRMKNERGIILFEIFGYESITSTVPGFTLTDHVGFKILAHHYQTNNPSFHSCTDGKSGLTRGLLWQCDSLSRIREILRNRNRRLASFFDDMEKELAGYKEKAESLDLVQEQVAEYESRFQRYEERIGELSAKIKELNHFKFVCHVLKCRIDEIDQPIRDMLLEPDHKGRPLF